MVSSSSDGSCKIWETSSASVVCEPICGGLGSLTSCLIAEVSKTDNNFDAEQFYLGGNEAIFVGSEEGHFALIHVTSGEIFLKRGHTAAINSASLSGRHILAACEDGAVIIISCDSFEVLNFRYNLKFETLRRFKQKIKSLKNFIGEKVI